MERKLKLASWYESADLEIVADSGSQIRRLTSAPAITHNIYCEQPYCSADGNRLALLRKTDPDPYVPSTLLVYDIPSHRLARLESGISGIACAAYSGILFVTVGQGNSARLVRFDLNTLDREDLFAWDGLPCGLATISADLRFGLTSSMDLRFGLISSQKPLSDFQIVRVDLGNGQSDVIHESPDICNPHLQYRLHSARRILVQESRGGRLDEHGNLMRACDERGVGLYSIADDGSDRQDLPVGLPHTPSTTGHACWVGDTDSVLVSLHVLYSDGEKRGNILELRPGVPKPRVIFETLHVWTHISVSKCGHYFVTDSYQIPDKPILLGSIRTGKTRILCNGITPGGGAQYNHLHPYITSDNQWVVFNSDRTGLAQVYIASIPDDFLASLD